MKKYETREKLFGGVIPEIEVEIVTTYTQDSNGVIQIQVDIDPPMKQLSEKEMLEVDKYLMKKWGLE